MHVYLISWFGLVIIIGILLPIVLFLLRGLHLLIKLMGDLWIATNFTSLTWAIVQELISTSPHTSRQ